MSQIERAWAAGFFDGEGSTGCYSGVLKVGISQQHPAVLERFAQAVGEGYVNGPYLRRGKQVWTFTAQGLGAARLHSKLAPFLGEVKRAQADNAIALWQGRPVADMSEILRERWRQSKENGWEPKPITHGTRTGYIRGCRCTSCRNANCEYVKNHRKKLAETPSGLV